MGRFWPGGNVEGIVNLWQAETGAGVGFVPRHPQTAPPGDQGDAPLLVSANHDRR